MDEDARFMSKALKLAALGRGSTSPNPLVGAIVIQRDKIIGKGYHQKAGTPHAELFALQEAGELAEGSTLYVTLEPCCHYGRTPPCTEAIIKAGIKRVVVAVLDPNPLVAGKGVRRLREAGIEVQVGVLEEEAERLNEAFFKYIRMRKPFVTLKAAMSLDGKIATSTGDSRWITGEDARLYVQQLRVESDAIMVGIGTVLADDPLLTVRLPGESKKPLRVILDSSLCLPEDSKLVQTAREVPVIVAAVRGKYQEQKRVLLEQQGVEVWDFPGVDGRVNLENVLEELGKREVVALLLEGGGTLNSSFLEGGLVDKFILFLAPLIIGGRDAPGAFGGAGYPRLKDALGLGNLGIERIGRDLMVTAYPVERGSGCICSQDL